MVIGSLVDGAGMSHTMNEYTPQVPRHPSNILGDFWPIAEKFLTRLHVLIVDGEPLIRWSIAETLADAGCDVAEAGDAREALERIAAAPAPDVILLDFRSPDSSDLRLLEAIRRVAPQSSVIVMTAYGTSDIWADAIALGAYRVVNKPIEMSDIVLLVQEAHAAAR